VFTLFVLLVSRGIAQLPAPPTVPRGVFALIKSGAPTGSSALSNPDVDGISLREGWNAVNPSEDTYDWSYFDTEIAKAKNAGKKVLIRVLDGGTSLPDWVRAASEAAGEPTFSFYETAAQGGQIVTEPVFWAPTLLAKKAKLIAAFGARYNSNPTVAIVTCQFAGARSDDWNVPDSTTVDGIPPTGSTQTSRWLAAGYTTARMVDAGNQVVNNTMAAFPDKPVGLAIGRTSTTLDPEGKDYIAQIVTSNARTMWGNRMVATKNSISAKMTPPPPPIGSFWRLLWDSQPEVGGQMLWFTYNDSTYRNNGGVPADPTTVLEKAVDLAHSYGLNYLEIYQADVAGLPSAIHYAHTILTAGVASGAYGPTLPSGWELAAVGDFDGAGHLDYLLYNAATRQTAIWYMNNNVLMSGAHGPSLPGGWSVIGVADFNGDGHPDYLMFNPSTRQTAIWYLNNNVFSSGLLGPTIPAGWTLIGVADFNGDGHPDYLMFNPSTLRTAIWYLSNNVFRSGLLGPTLPSGWELAAIGDFNGDGRPDYVLYNRITNQTAIW
jgi:hypothetical protein